ncbi:unnamed protein product [Caenorhabditis angaria]|uniref:CENP-V/GFA domain-containing protein n=1 Tax=Caenorhabditis angaria TaxID=860376 RepID=A0A9P1N5K3_9PELO|nr:unnamed protein product [Caenorhabditis angaria]
MDVEHQGSCHCEAIRWKFRAPQNLNGIQCNCSICHKKQNHHVIIKKDRFELLTGADNLTTYTFNTGAAKHQFCKTCGIQSFYFPRSNPDDIAIMPHCVNGNTIKSITWTYFDGQNWEKHMINNAPTAL